MGIIPRTAARTYLLCSDAAAVAFDPRPHVLDELLRLLVQQGSRPFAVIETIPWNGPETRSPAYELARLKNWFWMAPVRASEAGGSVISLSDRLLIELHPAATAADVRLGRRLPYLMLELHPLRVRVEPLVDEAGWVTCHVEGHDLPTAHGHAEGMVVVWDPQTPTQHPPPIRDRTLHTLLGAE